MMVWSIIPVKAKDIRVERVTETDEITTLKCVSYVMRSRKRTRQAGI